MDQVRLHSEVSAAEIANEFLDLTANRLNFRFILKRLSRIFFPKSHKILVTMTSQILPRNLLAGNLRRDSNIVAPTKIHRYENVKTRFPTNGGEKFAFLTNLTFYFNSELPLTRFVRLKMFNRVVRRRKTTNLLFHSRYGMLRNSNKFCGVSSH